MLIRNFDWSELCLPELHHVAQCKFEKSLNIFELTREHETFIQSDFCYDVQFYDSCCH